MTRSGVTIFSLKNNTINPELITSIETKEKDPHRLRLKVIADEFLWLKEKYPPSLIVLERGFGRFHNSTQAIFKVHGVINYLFNDIEQIYYPPKTIKLTIINGNASKELIKKIIKVVYPEVHFNNDDESDSFAVGLTYFIKNKIIEWDKESLRKQLRNKKHKKGV